VTRARTRPTRGWLAAISALAALLSGCAANVADLPLPATGVGGPSYQLTAVFEIGRAHV